MLSIKKLRKEALALINKNLNKIDGRSIKKYYQIANYAQRSKIDSLISTIENNKLPVAKLVVEENKNLDKGINDDDDDIIVVKKPLKKQIKTKMLTLKNISKPKNKIIKSEKVIKLFVSGSANITYFNKGKKGYFSRDELFNVTINVPRSKQNDKDFIDNEVMNDLSLSGVFNNDSYDIKINNINLSKISIINESTLNKSTNINEFMMKNAVYPKLDIKGLEEYKFEPYKCVYGALKYKYGFEEDELLNIFQTYLNQLEKNTNDKLF